MVNTTVVNSTRKYSNIFGGKIFWQISDSEISKIFDIRSQVVNQRKGYGKMVRRVW